MMAMFNWGSAYKSFYSQIVPSLLHVSLSEFGDPTLMEDAAPRNINIPGPVLLGLTFAKQIEIDYIASGEKTEVSGIETVDRSPWFSGGPVPTTLTQVLQHAPIWGHSDEDEVTEGSGALEFIARMDFSVSVIPDQRRRNSTGLWGAQMMIAVQERYDIPFEIPEESDPCTPYYDYFSYSAVNFFSVDEPDGYSASTYSVDFAGVDVPTYYDSDETLGECTEVEGIYYPPENSVTKGQVSGSCNGSFVNWLDWQ